jgi:DNA polymerase elongation subunit (family B)
MKHLLYGIDEEENIVNIQNVPRSPVVQIFSRINGKVESRYENFDLYAYLNHNDPVLELIPEKYIVPLKGDNYYNRVIKTRDWDAYQTAKGSEDVYAPQYNILYQLQTGKTPLKGMTSKDTVVLFFDIEVYTTPGYNFPLAERDGDKIIMIAVKTNQGFEQVIHGDDEKELIGRFITLVNRIDPDIISNHNIFGFDLPYLVSRCRKVGLKFSIGRDGSEPRSFDTEIKFAERKSAYTNFQIYGRDVLDTYFFAQQADIGKREMPSYNLKDIVKWLGKASDTREYIAGEQISAMWDLDRDRLIAYALDDVRETEILFDSFGGSTFMSTQFFPFNLQDTARYGTGNKCEALFLREYMRQGWSVPKRGERRDFTGGFAGCMVYGLIEEPTVGIDVESLYPTLAEDLHICPKHDQIKMFPHVVKLLKAERLRCKTNAKKAQTADERSMWSATDVSVKILLNTLAFGWLSSEWNPWNDYDEAERITTNGQRVIKSMIYNAQEVGGVPIKIDTDGMLTTIPEPYTAESFVDYLQEMVNTWIDFGLFDGAFDHYFENIK